MHDRAMHKVYMQSNRLKEFWISIHFQCKLLCAYTQSLRLHANVAQTYIKICEKSKLKEIKHMSIIKQKYMC